MGKNHILSDVFATLMISFAIIVTMFHLVLRFMTPLYGAILIIAGLITAIIFLFIGEDRRRNMRIVSICCNSIAIGSIFGLLFMLLELTLPIIESVIIAAVFAGLIFLMYFLFYICNKRVLPGIIIFLVLLGGGMFYYSLSFKGLDEPYSLYISMFFALTVIHYIVSLIVVTSDKKTIIDGMAYGYFGITLAMLVVAGIFLLIASDGDLDIDVPTGSGRSTSSKSRTVKPTASSRGARANASPSAKVSGVTTKIHSSTSDSIERGLDIASDMAYATGDIIENAALISEAIAPGVEYSYQNYMLYNAYYITYLGPVLENLTLRQIGELNKLEIQFMEGKFSLVEYQKKLDKYK